MTWVVTAVAVVTAYGQYQTGKIQEAEMKRQANEAELEASGTELIRRQEINRRLAMNVVGQSTGGILGEGTPKSIALSDAKNIGISESVETLSDRLKQAQLRRRGSAYAQAGRIQAGSTLLTSFVGGLQSGGSSTSSSASVAPSSSANVSAFG